MPPMTRAEITAEMDEIFEADQLEGGEIIRALEDWMTKCTLLADLEEPFQETVLQAVKDVAVHQGANIAELDDMDFDEVADEAGWEEDEMAGIVVNAVAEVMLVTEIAVVLLESLRERDAAEMNTP